MSAASSAANAWTAGFGLADCGPSAASGGMHGRLDGVIVGIGVDVVDIARLQSALRRTPSLASRLFTDGERGRGPASLAACFAAKEATAKALGAPAGLRWADVEVTHDGAGRPLLAVSGTVAEAAVRCGVLRWHLSITHDGGLSVAMVVAEG